MATFLFDAPKGSVVLSNCELCVKLVSDYSNMSSSSNNVYLSHLPDFFDSVMINTLDSFSFHVQFSIGILLKVVALRKCFCTAYVVPLSTCQI